MSGRKIFIEEQFDLYDLLKGTDDYTFKIFTASIFLTLTVSQNA